MIELTVKTLDSQDHSFSLDDDITVRGFKEYIAESVAVPADSQRLIYCGRVLQDDKKLNDYNVNGKVIHLVQRAPPQPGQRGNEGEQRQNTTQNTNHFHRAHYRVIRDINLHNAHDGPNAQVHGNTMYLGAMTLPTEVVEGHGLPLPQLSNTLSNSRMVMAENMLTNANRILDRLNNPVAPTPEASNERQSTSSTENSDVNMDTSSESSSRSAPTSSGNREGLALIDYITNMLDTMIKDMLRMIGCRLVESEQVEDFSEEAEGASNRNNTPSDTASQPEDPLNLIFSNNTPSNLSDRLRAPPTEPRPPQMADLLKMLMNTQDRLRPFLERYRVLMATDPVLRATGTGADSVTENQMVVNEVSRILHYIAHANHALSDIIVDMGQAPPRNLSCRPIVIQQSAIVQAGIPIQVEAHISVNEHNARANRTETNGSTQTQNESSDSAESRENSSQEQRPQQQQQQQQQNSSSSSHQRFDHQSNSDQPPRTEQQQQQQQRNQTPLSSLFSSVFNLPSNVEVLMEVSPDSSMDLNSTDEQGSNSTPNNNENRGNPMGRGASWMFPPGAPPTDLIRNLMHAVAGHIVQDPSGMSANQSMNPINITHSQHTIGVTIDSNGQNSGQSTQARNNVGTHPTTSTQTRSTSRPHVFHSHGLGLGPVSDPFLPCNSHHLRRWSTTGVNLNQNQQNTKHVNGDKYLQILRRNLPSAFFTSHRDAFAHTLRNMVQILSNGKVEVRFSNEIPASVTSGITLANLMEIPSTVEAQNNLIFDLTLHMARNVLMEDVFCLPWGFYNIFDSLRKPIREFIRDKTKSTGCVDDFVDLVCDSLIPPLSTILLDKKDGNTGHDTFDIVLSVESVFRRLLPRVIQLFCNEELNNDVFQMRAKTVFIDLITQFCCVLLYFYNGDQLKLMNTVRRLLAYLATYMFPSISKWVITKLANQLKRTILDRSTAARLPYDRIVPLLVKKKPVEALVSEDANFPGHEILPADWVPTIALDGASQRRSAPAGGITNFSDAYLGCLPCKRRKVIQQEKWQIVANPTSNHSTVSASIERMVRESISRVGVAEVEGAAAAVANDSAVKTAFGQAIQDHGHSRDHGSDFPNSERFPNATKFFCKKPRR